MVHVGIDVSKADLHVAIHEGAQRCFPNTPSGHRKVVTWLEGKGEVRAVLEPTGRYHLGIAGALAAHDDMSVMLVNPRVAKSFAKARDQRGKADGVDARMLAAFGTVMDFRAWRAPSEQARRLQALVRRRAQLVTQRTQEKNRATELRATCVDEFLLEDIDACTTFLDERIKDLEKKALALMDTSEELREWLRLLTSIPGVGNVLAMVITSELLALPPDMDARQLTAYAGLDPVRHQSGRSDTRGGISRKGNKRLRTALYLAAWTAGRHSPHVRDWKERAQARGKPAGVVTVAIARRLLHAIHGMRQTQTNWDGSRFNQHYAPNPVEST
jgi:transposase